MTKKFVTRYDKKAWELRKNLGYEGSFKESPLPSKSLLDGLVPLDYDEIDEIRSKDHDSGTADDLDRSKWGNNIVAKDRIFLGESSSGKETFATGGCKEVEGKLRVDLLPAEALLGYAEVMTFGCTKYGDRNWEKGIPFSAFYGAALRHMLKWQSGVDNDQESGYNHLKHALWNIGSLVAFIERDRKDLDDRPKQD